MQNKTPLTQNNHTDQFAGEELAHRARLVGQALERAHRSSEPPTLFQQAAEAALLACGTVEAPGTTPAPSEEPQKSFGRFGITRPTAAPGRVPVKDDGHRRREHDGPPKLVPDASKGGRGFPGSGRAILAAAALGSLLAFGTAQAQDYQGATQQDLYDYNSHQSDEAAQAAADAAAEETQRSASDAAARSASQLEQQLDDEYSRHEAEDQESFDTYSHALAPSYGSSATEDAPSYYGPTSMGDDRW